jgi:hypothetical protein
MISNGSRRITVALGRLASGVSVWRVSGQRPASRTARNVVSAGVVLATLALAPPTAAADPTFTVMNADGGIYWRSAPDWNAAEAVSGNGLYPGTVISVGFYQSGAANVPGSGDGM